MKKFNLLVFAMALATAVITVGCGGSDDEAPKPGQPGYTGPAYTPPPVNTGYNPYCGVGQVFNGTSCVPYNGGAISCTNNYVWNTQYNSCVPNNFNCPSGTTWNQLGCDGAGTSVPNYGSGGWSCYQVQYSQMTGMYYYTCRYVQYMPNNRCVMTWYGPYCY